MLVAAAGLATFHRPLLMGNVGEVDPGRVYRSAQPKGNLARLIDEHHLQSILNLRGGSYADDWYAAEVAATGDRGVDFYDVPMQATRRPSRGELLTLIDLLDRCRYPLLIHCKSGADRTGLVSGLYLMTRRDVPPRRALDAFSIRFGHVPIGGPQRLHEPFEEYARWLESEGLSHDDERFRGWVERHYRDEGPVEFEPVRPGPRLGPPPTRGRTGRE